MQGKCGNGVKSVTGGIKLTTVSHTLKPNKKCTLKTSVLSKMEKILYKWFLNNVRHLPVTRDIIKQKALDLYSSLNPTSNVQFLVSDGWLQRFKSNYPKQNLLILLKKN